MPPKSPAPKPPMMEALRIEGVKIVPPNVGDVGGLELGVPTV